MAIYNVSLNNPIIAEDMIMIFNSRDNWDELRNKSFYISGASGMIASYLVMYLIYLNEVKDFNITIYAGIRNNEKARLRFGEYVDKMYFML